MDDKITKAMTYGGLIIASLSILLFPQALNSTNFKSKYLLYTVYKLVTSIGFALAALGALLGNTGTFTKTVAIVAIIIFIFIIAIQIFSFYTFFSK